LSLKHKIKIDAAVKNECGIKDQLSTKRSSRPLPLFCNKWIHYFEDFHLYSYASSRYM